MSKYIKVYFMQAPPGTGYHSGRVHSVPPAKAREYITAGLARHTTPVLPENFPHRDILTSAGIETIDDLKGTENLKELSDEIDEQMEQDIAEFLGIKEPKEDPDKEKEEEPKAKKVNKKSGKGKK